MAAETSTASAASGPARLPGRELARFAAFELSLWSLVYGFYLAVRGIAIASPNEALANAREVVHLERALGLFHEESLQAAFGAADGALSVYYLLGFAPLLAGILVWLALAHRPLYRELRSLLLVSISLAVVVHVLLPVAPPRLVPGLGIADTVGLDHDNGSFAGIPFNPYAAMPSMHVGWSLLAGLVALKASRSPLLRGFFAAQPVVMAVAVTATGNHFFLDSVAGVVVALAAIGLWKLGRGRLLHLRVEQVVVAETAPTSAPVISCQESDRPSAWSRWPQRGAGELRLAMGRKHRAMSFDRATGLTCRGWL